MAMKSRGFWFVFFLCWLLSFHCFPSTPDTPITVVQNVSYVENSDTLQKLDVYFQPQEKGLPVLVYIHGGAWVTGDKCILRKQAKRMTRHGFVFVSVNYRLSPFVTHPDHVYDCAKAVSWVKRNIHVFGGDPGKMFIAGYSAGGHLCALLACDPRYLDSVSMTPHQIRGFLVMGPGGLDLDRMESDPSSNTLREGFYKMVFGDPSGWAEACPTTHIQGDEPPLFVAVAEFDRLICRSDCLRFVTRSRELGGDVRFYVIPGKTHLTAFLSLGQENDPLTQEIMPFIQKNRE
jgi:acetyl esterase/lipase